MPQAAAWGSQPKVLGALRADMLGLDRNECSSRVVEWSLIPLQVYQNKKIENNKVEGQSLLSILLKMNNK